eukprot:SAG11_NODE_17372_length_520_cov_1.584323_2_plen_72_part_01
MPYMTNASLDLTMLGGSCFHMAPTQLFASQVRMVHQRAVPDNVQMEMCPHYRLLLLQNKRPRDFDSDKFFEI